MRQDVGVDGYRSPIPEELQWRAWAADPEGITGDELMAFPRAETSGRFNNLLIGP